MNHLPDLTPDELRHVMERRAAVAAQAGPPTMAQSVSAEEWNLLQLHRVAQQARVPGSGVISNLPDPVQQLHAVAIVVLRSIREEIVARTDGGDPPYRNVQDMVTRWLGILGADESRSSNPGTG